VDGRLAIIVPTPGTGGRYRATLRAPRDATSTVFTVQAVDAQGHLSTPAEADLRLRPNQKPVANAGADQTVPTNVRTTLDGGASYDPDGSPLTYRWTLIGKPAGSMATLSDATSRTPSLVPDVPETYTLSLVVNDG